MSRRFLSFTLDPALADPESGAFKRQIAYYLGAEIDLIVFRAGLPLAFAREGVRVIRLGGASKPAVFLRALRRVFFGPRPDAVVAQEAGPLGLLAWLAAAWHNAELLLQDHSGLFARRPFGWKEWWFRPVSAWLFRRAARVRVVSERARAGLERIGVQEGRIAVIPIAADLARFSAVRRHPAEPPLLVCVARLEAEKGVDTLLDAFARLGDGRVRLLVIGAGSCRGALGRQCERLGISDRVEFFGKGSPEVIAEAFSRASAYVQPSRFEGWGIAVVEAAAAGVPIVMADVGCAGELIRDGEGGRVVPPDDARAMASALDGALADPVTADRRANRARACALALPGVEETARAVRVWLGFAT